MDRLLEKLLELANQRNLFALMLKELVLVVEKLTLLSEKLALLI